MTWLALALALACAVLLVQLVRLGRRSTLSPTLATPDPDRDETVDSPVEWKQVLDALPVGVIAADGDGREIGRNSVVDTMVTARHGQVLVDAACARLLARAGAGEWGVEIVELVGPPLQVIEVIAHTVSSTTVLTVTDVTERIRLDQVRTDLVANISHELKTPVGAMSVLAETLEGGAADETGARLARKIVDEAQRMARTIDGLLELSRIEMGAERPRDRVDLGHAVSEAVERVRPLAERQGVEVSSSIEEGLCIRGDHAQLVSAVGNLVDNAVHYTPGAGEVQVLAVRRAGAAVVEVIDRGVGIPATDLDRIFQRFYRVDRARSRATGGTGLGLAIVRNVASNHDGVVEVSSREGEGSTFRIVLPLDREEPRQEERQ